MVCQNSTPVPCHSFCSPPVTKTGNDVQILHLIGVDSTHTSNEWLQTSLASGQRPPLLRQARARLFSPSGLSAPGFGSTVPIKAG